MGVWVLRIFLMGLILAAVLSVGGYMWLRSYLASAEFRQKIVDRAELSLQAESSLSPLRWDGFRVNADSFRADGSSKIKEISVEGVKTGINAGGVTRGVWSVLPSRITRITATYDMTAAALAPVEIVPVEDGTSDVPVKKAWYDSWIPQKIETDSLIVSDTKLRVILPSGTAELAGTRWEAEPMQGFEKAKFRALGGKITLPFDWAPTLNLNQMRLTYQSGYLYLTNSTFGIYENGHLDLSGECDLTQQSYSFEGYMRDVLCNEVLSADWKQRLTGKIESDFTIRSSQSAPIIKGHASIHQGTLTALPVLEKLAAYSQSLRFRTLTLHEAQCDYEWSGDRITLTKVRIGSEGLARMEGQVTFLRDAADQPFRLDGNFRVGLAPGTLSQIPGAEEDVFLPGERGLLWAPMRLSGTLDDPKEDLSARLMAAAGARMFDIIPATGQKVLKYTQQVVDEVGIGSVSKMVDGTKGVIDSSTETLKTVSDAVKTGTDVVDGVGSVVGGVLDIFGSKKAQPAPPVPVDPEKVVPPAKEPPLPPEKPAN